MTDYRVPLFSIEHTSPQLLPYLSPAYWEAEQLLDTDPTQNGTGKPGLLRSIATSLAIERSLTEQLPPFPVRSYVGGMNFSAEHFEDGMIVVFRQETITATNDLVLTGFMKAAAEKFGEQPLPERPDDLSFAISKSDSTYIANATGSLSYRSKLEFGVIESDRKGKKILTAIASKAVSQLANGRIVVEPNATSMSPDIALGVTEYTEGDYLCTERFSRVNAIDVCRAPRPFMSKGSKTGRKFGVPSLKTVQPLRLGN